VKNKAILFIILIAAIGCKKGNNGGNVTLTGTLTGCPLHSSCTYSYYNNADFNLSVQPPVAGDKTVFIYKAIDNGLCNAETALYIKTTSGSNSFDITSDEIAAGQLVNYSFSCACCDVIANVKPISGEVKGKTADGSHWLINATVVLGTAIDKPLDTIKVNQTFTATPLP